MSADLIWMLTRKNSCFIRQHKGAGNDAIFTTEPNNLMQVHSYKYSGLANDKVVGVDESSEGKGCVLSLKTTKAENAGKPAATFREIELTKDFKKVAKTISGMASGKQGLYRTDLTNTAVTRWYKINKSHKKSKAKADA